MSDGAVDDGTTWTTLGGVKIFLKLILDCDPDAAWRALHSPTVFRQVALPWLDFRSEELTGFPTVWRGEPPAGPTIWQGEEHRVTVRALGAVSIGTQTIRLDTLRSTDPNGSEVRVLRDSGGGTSGLLAALPHLDHRMAISPAGPDEHGRSRTLYRDRLVVKAGLLTPLAWGALWTFWQWRGMRLRQLAPGWE